MVPYMKFPIWCLRIERFLGVFTQSIFSSTIVIEGDHALGYTFYDCHSSRYSAPNSGNQHPLANAFEANQRSKIRNRNSLRPGTSLSIARLSGNSTSEVMVSELQRSSADTAQLAKGVAAQRAGRYGAGRSLSRSTLRLEGPRELDTMNRCVC